MKPMRTFLLIITIMILTFFLVAAILPDAYHMERRVAIDASPSQVFEQVNELENWKNWNPEMPEMQFNEIPKGAGARQEWETPKGGKGYLEIKRAVPGQIIQAEMKFPGYDTFETNWMLRPEGDSTYATWGMDFGSLDYPLGRYSGVLTNKRMQANIYVGLQNLKTHLEEDQE